MLMATRKPKRGTAEMTEFGRTLNLLMVEHQVYEWKDLIEALEAVGYEIGQPRLSGYLYGDRNPRRPQELFDAIARALELDEEEKMRLIYSYGYPKGSGERITDEKVRRARAAEEEVKARKRARDGAGGSLDGPGDNRV
jgi:hypothetical protein